MSAPSRPAAEQQRSDRDDKPCILHSSSASLAGAADAEQHPAFRELLLERSLRGLVGVPGAGELDRLVLVDVGGTQLRASSGGQDYGHGLIVRRRHRTLQRALGGRHDQLQGHFVIKIFNIVVKFYEPLRVKILNPLRKVIENVPGGKPVETGSSRDEKGDCLRAKHLMFPAVVELLGHNCPELTSNPSLSRRSGALGLDQSPIPGWTS